MGGSYMETSKNHENLKLGGGHLHGYMGACPGQYALTAHGRINHGDSWFEHD